MRSFIIGGLVFVVLDVGCSRHLIQIDAAGVASFSLILGIVWVAATVHDLLKEGGRNPRCAVAVRPEDCAFGHKSCEAKGPSDGEAPLEHPQACRAGDATLR